MPILYETYALPLQQRRRYQATQTKRYPIPWPSKMGPGTNIQVIKLSLPYNESRVHSVSLAVNGTLEIHLASIFTPVTVAAEFYVNGHYVIGKKLGPCIGGCNMSFTDTTSIMGYVHEGENDFQMTFRQSWSPFGTVSSIKDVAGYIELEYSGKEPPAPEPEKELWEKVADYLKWGIIGAVAIGGVYVGVKTIREMRGRKT